MITPELRNLGAYNVALQAGARAGLTIVGPLEVHAGVSGWYFPSTAGDGSVAAFLAGLRFEPRIANIGWLFVDCEGGVGYTGGGVRPMLDAGLGFEFRATPWLAIGPVGRYGRVFAQTGDVLIDAQFWSAGLSVTLRSPPPAPPPLVRPPPPVMDADHDSVPDASDRCPREARGRYPDPEREGCPDGDADRDGVVDHRDWCRIEEIGTYPDPTWPGCPLPDDDHDGVPNRLDTCPLRLPGAHPDSAWPGCPMADADDDGISDERDLCATDPRGDSPDPDRLGCPDGDVDGDGALDHSDECREEPSGLHPDIGRRGCPLPDADRDSVADATDRCPSVAGAPSSASARNGCPGPAIVRGARIEPVRPVAFAMHTARLIASSEPSLRAIATVLRDERGIVRLAIEVNSDDEADAARNGALSTLRAETIRFWLVSHGVDATRLVARAVQSAPAAASPSPRARRTPAARVEFLILEPRIR